MRSTAKAGIIAVTKSVGHEVAPFGIRVNAVAPGPIPTEVFMEFLKLEESDIPQLGARFGIPLGRVGTPEDIAPACVYLASKASSWMTGQVLDIRGGP